MKARGTGNLLVVLQLLPEVGEHLERDLHALFLLPRSSSTCCCWRPGLHKPESQKIQTYPPLRFEFLRMHDTQRHAL
jgi:hypothetical protein